MSKEAYLSLFSDFMYHIGNNIKFDTKESKLLLPRLQHALYCVEELHVPRKYPKMVNNEHFSRKMKNIEGTISEKLYQHGSIRESFLQADSDGTGYIDPREFRNILRMYEIVLEEDELQYLVQKYDSNQNGMLNYTDFIKLGQAQSGMRSEAQTAYHGDLHAVAVNNNEDEEIVRKSEFEVVSMIRAKLYQRFKSVTDLFLHLDYRKNSQLSMEELYDGLLGYGIDVNKHTLFAIMRQYAHEDGTLSVQEFSQFLDSTSMNAFPEKIAEDAMVQDNNQMEKMVPVSNTKEEFVKELNAYDTKVPEYTRQFVTPKSLNSMTKLTLQMAQLLRDTGKQMKNVFKILDRDHTGSISPSNFFQGLKKLDIHDFPREETDRILSYFDENGNGQLEFHEFVKMMQTMYQEDTQIRRQQQFHRKPEKCTF